MKDKKAVTITNAFQKVLDGSNHKPNKIWVDKASEFLQQVNEIMARKSTIETYSIHIEGKSVIAERFKIYKYITSISKNVYTNKLNDIVNKYNNTYHRTIKMKPNDVKPIDVKPSIYVNFNTGDNVRISKYENIFAKGYVPNWSEEVFLIKKVQNTVPWTYLISDLNGVEIVGTFYEKALQKTNQKEFRAPKLTKRKSDKLNVKWKGYNSSFNSWIDKTDIIKMSEHFPEPNSSGGRAKVQFDLSNYATKADLKNATGVHTSKFAKKFDLVSLKSEGDKLDTDKLEKVPTGLNSLKSKADKLDVDKLVTVPVDLSKLSDLVKNDVVKKLYIMLRSKILKIKYLMLLT